VCLEEVHPLGEMAARPTLGLSTAKKSGYALQIAVRQRNTNAAAEASVRSTSKSEKFKRYYDRLWQAEAAPGGCQSTIPRRFWTAFGGTETWM